MNIPTHVDWAQAVSFREKAETLTPLEWSLTTDGWQKTETIHDMIRGAGRIPRSFVSGSCVQMGMLREEVDAAIMALRESGYLSEDGEHLVAQEPDMETRTAPVCGRRKD